MTIFEFSSIACIEIVSEFIYGIYVFLVESSLLSKLSSTLLFIF